MFKPQKNILIRSIFTALVFLSAWNIASAGTFVQGGHSGGWIDPLLPGHGMFVEVIKSETSPTGLAVVVAWYAFINGEQTWIVGIGNVIQEDSDQIARISAFIYEGNDFPPNYVPSQTLEIPWGEMTMAFDGCDMATFTYSSTQPGFGSGEIELTRITSIAGTACDGELGQDNNPDDHGDFWQTATAFTHKNLPLQSLNISAELDPVGDVDVFLITVHKRSDLTLFTRGSTDTMGTLYLLEDLAETEIETSDVGGTDDNFNLNIALAEPGTYTLHVEAGDTSVSEKGPYLLTVTIEQK